MKSHLREHRIPRHQRRKVERIAARRRGRRETVSDFLRHLRPAVAGGGAR